MNGFNGGKAGKNASQTIKSLTDLGTNFKEIVTNFKDGYYDLEKYFGNKKTLGIFDPKSLLGSSINGIKNVWTELDTSTKATIKTLGKLSAAIAGVYAAYKLISLPETVANQRNEAAQAAANAVTDTQTQIAQYKAQIQEYRTIMGDQTSSIEEVTSAKKGLIDVQKELIDNFGSEADGIKLVTEAINGQTDALDNFAIAAYNQSKADFNQKTWEQHLYDYINTYMPNVNYMFGELLDGNLVDPSKLPDAPTNLEAMVREMSSEYIEIQKSGNELLDRYISKINGVESNYTGDAFVIKGNQMEVLALLNQISSLSNGYKNIDDFSQALSNATSETSSFVDSNKALYDQYLLYEKIFQDDSLKGFYNNLLDVKNEYDTALSNDDTAGIKESISKYAELYNQISDITTNSDLRYYFENLNADMTNLVGEFNFDQAVKSNTNNIKKELLDLGHVFSEISENELRKFNWALYPDDSEIGQAYQKLTDIANEYGISIDTLVNKMIDFEAIQSDAYKSLVKQFGSDKIQQLSQKDLEFAYRIENIGAYTFDELRDEIDNLRAKAENSIDLNLRTNLDNWEALSGDDGEPAYRADYDKYTEALKKGKELYTSGMIGSKEFKAIAKMFSMSGMEDATNWTENVKYLGKYFAKGSTGLQKFVAQLSKTTDESGEFFAQWDDGTNSWTINTSNMEMMAAKLGMPLEMLTVLLEALRDYGLTKDWFGSYEEGISHLGDLYGELADKKSRLEEMKLLPDDDPRKSQSAIEQLEKEIGILEGRIKSTKNSLNDLLNSSVDDYMNEYDIAKETMEYLAKEYNKTLGDNSGAAKYTREAILKELGELQGKYGIDFKINADNKLAIGSIEEIEEQVENAKDELNKLRDSDGKINLDDQKVKDAYNEFVKLRRIQLEAEKPLPLDIDMSNLQAKSQYWLSTLEEQMNQITIDKELGIDTTEAEKRLKEFITKHHEFFLECGIDSRTYDELVEELQTETIEVPVEYTTSEIGSTFNSPINTTATLTVNIENEDDITNLKKSISEIPSDEEVNIDCTVTNQEQFEQVKEFIASRPNTTATITLNPDVPDNFGLKANQLAQPMLNAVPLTMTVNSEGVVTISGAETAASQANEVTNAVEEIPKLTIPTIEIQDNASPAIKSARQLLDSLNGRKAHTYLYTHKITSTEQGKVNGSVHLNGTAHANGSLFSPQNAMWHQIAYHMGTNYGIQHGAYIGGNWGIPYDQTALVGELGPEARIRVRDGKWDLLGEKGAELADLRKGDIIFNHKQTEQLLRNGYVTGRGKPIGFNAHVDGTIGGNAYSGVGGGTGLSFGVGGGHKYSSSSYSSTTAKSTAAAEKAAEDFSETVDFIALAIERMNAEIELHKSLAENLYQTYRNQNAELNVSISQTEELLKFQKKAYNRYMEQAKASGLSDEYVKLIQNGQLDIRTITDEDLKKKIDEYTEYYNLAQDTRQEIVNTAQSLNELKLQKLDNIVDDFDRITDNASTLYDMIEVLQELNELKGISKTVDDLVKLMEIQVDIAGYKQGEAERLTKEFEALVASGDIDKYNDDWYEWIDQINEAKTEAIEAEKAAYELKNEIFELQFVKPLEKTIEQLTIAEDELSTLLDLLGEAELFDENGISVTFSFAGISKLAMLGEQLALAKKRSAEWSKAISELDKNLANGNITQEQYNEKLKEYSDGQRQAALDTKAAMDAIIDLRIEGLEKSYSAYEKLIDIRKKDKEAQKEYQDQQKALSDKQSEINALEAQIKMAQDDPAQAQRVKQLEAQKKELQDEYNDMVKENRYNAESEAYDEDLENYREYVDEETKKLQSDLNYRSQIIQETLGIVSDNHEDTYDHLSMLAEVYGVVLQTNVVDKWSDATTAAQAYYDAVNKAAAQAQIVSDKIEVGTVKPTDTTPSDEQSKKDIAYSNPINSKYAYGESDINKLYQELLGRDADVEGLKTWLALQSKGGTLDDVRQGIMNSAEYKALKGQGSGNSNSESVTNSSNQNNSDVWKNIATNPSTKGANKYNKSIGYSIYDRIAWNGYKPGWASQKQLWSNLGGSGTYSGTSSQNVWMVEQLKKRGFRDGGVAELIKKSGEHGIAFVRNKEALVSDRHVPIMQDVLEAMPTIDNIFKGIQGTMGHYNLKPIDYNVTMHYDNMLNVEGSVDATVISNLKKFANEVSNQATNQVMKTLKNQSYKPGYKGLGR